MATRYVDSDALEIDEDDFASLEGLPFTGTVYVRERTGEISFTIEYVSGLRQGWYKEWEKGRPREQMLFHLHIVHGLHRRWHDNGQLAYEALKFYGLKLRELEWSEDGELTAERFSDRTDPVIAKKVAFVLRRVPAGQRIEIDHWIAQNAAKNDMELPNELS